MEEAVLASLRSVSDRVLKATSSTFKRYLYADINFDGRLIVLKGARGVGKTTLLLQYLKTVPPSSAIYLSLDHFLFTAHRMYTVVEALYASGVRTVVLDEVHKYADWSIEIKNLHDGFPDLKILATSSSALRIMSGSGDLSRRADVYELPGMSFREFLEFEYNYKHDAISLDDLIDNHVDIAHGLLDAGIDLKKFNRYLKRGYYPYFKASGHRYYDRVTTVVTQVIEVDLPPIFNIDYTSVRQVKKLLSIIARIAPFTPTISTLARDLEVGRDRVLRLLDYLHAANIIHLLKSNRRSDSAMTKPDKVFLENTNLMHALGLVVPNAGSIRETFVMSALHPTCAVSTPAKGDFLVNDRYTFEVGGPNKTFHQISDMANALLVKDKIEVGSKDILPMWLLGLGY